MAGLGCVMYADLSHHSTHRYHLRIPTVFSGETSHLAVPISVRIHQFRAKSFGCDANRGDAETLRRGDRVRPGGFAHPVHLDHRQGHGHEVGQRLLRDRRRRGRTYAASIEAERLLEAIEDEQVSQRPAPRHGFAVHQRERPPQTDTLRPPEIAAEKVEDR